MLPGSRTNRERHQGRDGGEGVRIRTGSPESCSADGEGLILMLVLQNVLWLLVLIGVMIIIHEAGHFWAARWFDVRVETFSFGFGPRLFGFRKGETDYRFSLILFGGYVKMTGEQPGDENADDPRSFLSRPRWQRLVIAFAGPFMNVVLAVGLLTGLFMVKYEKTADSDQQAIVAHVV